MKLNLNKPYMIFLYTVFFSFFFWIFLDFGILRSGFEKRADFFSLETLLLLFLYFILFISIYIGFNIKKKYRILEKLKNKNNISSNLIYLLFFLFGTLGVIFTYYKIIDILKIKGVLEAIISGKANQLKYALYDNYTLGVLSLRYVTGQTFTLFLIRRVIYKKKKLILDLLVIIELFLVILISARMILIYSLVTFLIFYTIKKEIKINLKALLFVGIVILILFFLNYSRNKEFYNQNYGLSFWGAGISEIKAYLGTPFQGAIIATRGVLSGNNMTIDEAYKYSTIEKSLTTNSAIWSLYLSFKTKYTFLFIQGTFIFTGIFYGIVLRFFYNLKNTCLYFSYSAIMYCFAEFWRLYLFNEGIVKVWIVIPIFIFLLYQIFKINKKWSKYENY